MTQILAMFAWNWQLDGWIVAAGMLCAMSCALLGNFLVLRRMSMMGDAISHAVLPGLAVAFLVTGSRESLPMFLGAAIVGVLTALFTQWVNRFGKVEESASMGVVFTALFAIGLILIVRAADSVDLDPGCVLYGAIEMVPLDLRSVGGFEVPRAVFSLACVFAADLFFVLLFYKELKISSFDPELATTLGINSTLMHYLLMTFTAITTVAAFESVGSILVVAMLIVPAAAAHLLTDRLWSMVLVSLILAAASAVLGHISALVVPTWFGFPDTSTAGMMAVVAGAIFTVALLASPRHGVISKLLHRAMLSLRIAREDMLGLMYRLEEIRGSPAAGNREPYTVAAAMLREGKGVGSITAAVVIRDLLWRRQVSRSEGGYRLTDRGRNDARLLVRSHRLWEGFLQKHLNLPTDHVHAPAERLEHITSPAMREELDERMDRPAIDPQGKAIPPAG
ncbi:MAG: metal ABC transporter permease [Tepidisphaeraceae bacterium]